MGDSEVQDLFRRAVAEDDAEALRAGFERLMGLAGEGLSPDREHALRSDGYEMVMPQSGEVVRGREAMRRMQEAYPVRGGPSISLRDVVGAGRVWVVQAVSDYGEGTPWFVVVIVELSDDGLIERETRYYTEGFEAPEWRAPFVESLSGRP